MRALVIVHPEPQSSEEREVVLKESIFPSHIEHLYIQIGNYLRDYRHLYDYIAYFGVESKDWNSSFIYPSIKLYASQMDHIPHRDLEAQLLDLKYQLMQRGIQQVDIAGVSRFCCVKEADVFLRGDFTTSWMMEEVADKEFDIDFELYDEIIAHKIRTRILEKLTDEPVEPAADPSTYFRRRRFYRYNPGIFSRE